MGTSKNLDAWSCGGWEVFIALNHQQAVGDGCCRWAHRTVRCATGHCLVRRHVTQPLGFWEKLTVGGFVLLWHRIVRCHTRQVMFTSGAPLTSAPTSAAHCSAVRAPLQSTALDSRCSAGAPDSPVAHRTV
jgi:hypothetical protein